MMIQPAFGESGLAWQLEANEKAYTTYQDAILRLYKEVDEGWCQLKASILNPEKGGVLYHPYENVRIFFYPKSYRVLVIKNHRTMSGPHSARLQLSDSNDNLHWLASCQIEGNFFDEDCITVEVFKSLKQHRFYIADKSAQDKLIL